MPRDPPLASPETGLQPDWIVSRRAIPADRSPGLLYFSVTPDCAGGALENS
jgi:hypothetical protein